MLATIALEYLPVRCIVGILPQERGREQQIFVDARLTLDATEAIRQDSITETVDYAEIAEDLREYVRHECFSLVETMAASCARRILSEHGKILAAEVTIHKPGAVPAARDVWAKVSMTREELPVQERG